MTSDTLPQTILAFAGQRTGKVALRRKVGGRYQDIPWEALGEEIRRYGRGMLRLGIGRGERVAIMAPNTPEWAYADLGAMAAGAVTVPVYHTEGMSTLRHLLADSGSRLLFLHSPRTAEELLRIRESLPCLERLILLEGRVDDPGVLSLAEFLSGAAEIPLERLEAALAQGAPEETATVVYTSGTTGTPKGACLSHRNILSNIEACASLFSLGEGDTCLSILPLSHVFERVDGYYFMLCRGVAIAYAEGLDAVPHNLREVRPTVMISVPRFYEKMYGRVLEAVERGGSAKRALFALAVRLGEVRARHALSSTPSRPLLRWVTTVVDRAVFTPLRERLGGRLRFFISGGAPLGREIALFFESAGLPIYEGYGLTETAGGIAVNAPGARRPGTVGRPFSQTEVRIADDGEILLRGTGVFPGYWNHPEETRRALVDGWFHTGDVGRMDEDGFLAITDRKKDLIVTSSGENIAPQPLENRLKSDPLLANAFVQGDRRPYLTALLVPDLDNLGNFARSQEIPSDTPCDLVTHPRIVEEIRNRIDRMQEGLPSFQRIKRFTLLSRDFSGEELTPTLKVRRKIVQEHFRSVLDGMYFPQDHGRHDQGFCVVEDLTESEQG